MAATNIAQEITRLTTAKADIKTAIEGKGVTVPSTTLLDGYAALVGQIQQGGAEEAPESDVNFYDYTGARVASYTIAEAKSLTQAEYNAILPPSHEGLTFQAWNWTLSDITSYNRRYIDIGANYITTDGKTHIFVTIPQGDSDTYIYIQWGKGTLTVDWGDSSDPYSEAKTAFGGKRITHTYAQGGDYEVKLSFNQSADDGCYGPMYMTSLNDYWPSNFIIKEWRCGNYMNFSYTGGFERRVESLLLSISTSTIITSLAAQQSKIVMVAFPRGCGLTGCQFLYCVIGKICFPKEITSINSKANPFTSTVTDKIVLPEMTSSSGTTAQATNLGYYANIVSYPLSWGGALGNQNFIVRIEIANGWIPPSSMSLNNATKWLKESIIDFFTKLGTTSTAITLTLGAENLGKLSADEKAIATNKGYTLA